MAIYALGEHEPLIDSTAYIHPDAVIIGQAIIGARSSVWPGAVIRADDWPIKIGDNTSVQDGAILHVDTTAATTIGSDCTVGHLAHLEGCVIGDHVLIGVGAIVLTGAKAEDWSIVGAGAVVPGTVTVPTRGLALGVPATIKENAAKDAHINKGPNSYVPRAERYTRELRRLD